MNLLISEMCTENKPTIHPGKLVSGLNITEVLYVPIGNDGHGHTVFDCFYGVKMDRLVTFF